MTDILIELPISLEMERSRFQEYLKDAHKKINTFALQHNWQTHVKINLIKGAEIFTTKVAFDEAVISAFLLEKSAKVPSTAVAVIANDILLMVSPDVYIEIYPQGMEEHFFEKLIIHELAHALHIRILNGDEGKMGPKWFYEGFAIHAANQFQEAEHHLNRDEMFSVILFDKDTGYRNYREIFELLLGKVGLEELLNHSRKPAFIDWINQLLEGELLEFEINKAVELRKNGTLKESNELLLSLVKLFPQHPYVNYQCAWSFDVLGEEAKAVPYYEKAIQLGIAGKDLEGAILGLGSTYRTLGEYEKSKETFLKGIEFFPNNKAIQVFFSMTLYNLKEHQMAMEILLDCLLQTTMDQEIINYKKAIEFYADKLNETWK